MERAFSSTACSSSSPAAPPREPFPRALTKKRVHLIVRHRNISLSGTVTFIADEVCLKVARPKNPRLRIGDSAQLKAEDGRQWSGTILCVDNDNLEHDEPDLYDFVWIRMETPSDKVSPGSAKNVLVMVNPVKLNLLVKVSLHVNQRNKWAFGKKYQRNKLVEVDLMAIGPQLRVGVNGFGEFEKLVIEMAVQSLSVQLVAIYSPVPPEIMVKVWRSSNVSISVKDDHTVIFEKLYYEKSKKDKDVILLKSEKMEVTVFRKPDRACWEKVNAHFVVECGTCFNYDKDVQSNDLIGFQVQAHDKETLDYCLRFLPQALYLRELYVVEPSMRVQLNNGNQGIAASSEAEAQCYLIQQHYLSTYLQDVSQKEVFADSNNDPTSLSFLAATVFLKKSKDADMSRDPKMSNLDLQVTLEKSENYSDIEGIPAWLCASSEEVGERLIAIMSLCLDIVRCMPVGGCRLQC